MSLIADTLKKVQDQREKEPGRIAETMLRAREALPRRVSHSLVWAVGAVPVVFLGIWFALIPEPPDTVVAQTADYSNTALTTHSETVAPVKDIAPPRQEESTGTRGTFTALSGGPEETVIPLMKGNTVLAGLEKNETAGTPVDELEQAAAEEEKVPHADEETVLEESTEETLTVAALDTTEHTGTPQAANPPITPNTETTDAHQKTAVDQKTEKETAVTPQIVAAMVPVPELPQESAEEQMHIEIVPFSKPESPLEKVAALTDNLKSQPEPVTTEPEPKPETVPTQPVTLNSEDTGQETDPVQIEVAPESSESEQVAHLDASAQSKDTIEVIPDPQSMERMEDSGLPPDARVQDDKQRYFNIAVHHHKNQDYFEALKFYEKAVRLDPGNAQIYNNRALVYQKLGRHRAAIDELTHAIRLDSRYVKAYNNLGLLYYYSGNALAAIQSFEKAIEIDPRNVESYNNLAILYKQQKQYSQAKNLYRKVILLAPKQSEAHYNLALLYEETGDLKAAIRHYSRFVETGAGNRPRLAGEVRLHIRKLRELSRS